MTGSPPDPSRRRFFRRFAGDVIAGVGQVGGVLEELRDQSAREAAAILQPGRDLPGAPGAGVSTEAMTTGGGGFRTPFRFAPDDDSVLLLIDQRLLPDRLVEVPVRSAYDAASSIKEMIVRGAPAIGQVAAIGLALSARMAANARPYPRRAILHGAANTLRNARPTAVNLGWAVDRLIARYEEIGDLSDDGAAIAAAMMDEAMTIVFEATTDHGMLAEAGLDVLPSPDGRPLEILTHCNTGPLAGGQFGTALGVVQAAHHAERPIHVWVDETRPYLQGARLTAWELQQAGVPYTLIADGAAGHVMARKGVDVVLVGADRIAANGDVANKVGTYTLAVLAARHGIPFYVCAPLSSVDLSTPDGASIPVEERAASEVLEVRGVRIAPHGTEALNPSFDITPAELVTGMVTEEGVVGRPFEEGLRAAMDRRRARRTAASWVRVGAPHVASSPAERPASSPAAPEPSASAPSAPAATAPTSEVTASEPPARSSDRDPRA